VRCVRHPGKLALTSRSLKRSGVQISFSPTKDTGLFPVGMSIGVPRKDFVRIGTSERVLAGLR
jgi:hypothetical protein